MIELLEVFLLPIVLLLRQPAVLIIAIIFIIVSIRKNKYYKSSAYYQITKNPYFSVRFDKGRYGEYLTYDDLRHYEMSGAKFLFNIYAPKKNGETTEIDVLMICKKGLFVLESKNYSGWIFGSEDQKNWYQTLPTGRGRSHKEHFYNPVMQNRTHIKHLKAFLGEQIPMRSIIVFSDRCTLKSVQMRSKDIRVVNRYNVAPVVDEICNQTPNDLLTDSEITEIYNKLYPFTQVDERAKEQHVANIHQNLNPQPVQQESTKQTRETPRNVPETATEQPIPAAEDAAVTPAMEEAPVSEADTPEKTDPVAPQALKCPKCGGELILRTATRGANAGNRFYGCSNYPKCKYIQNVTDKQ